MISPTDKTVDMPVGDTFVGMVDRDRFDPWLRERAVEAGAEMRIGAFKALHYDDDGVVHVNFQSKESGLESITVTTRSVVGADGARSAVARQAVPCSKDLRWVLAYHEIVEAPEQRSEQYDGDRCDVWYRGDLSPVSTSYRYSPRQARQYWCRQRGRQLFRRQIGSRVALQKPGSIPARRCAGGGLPFP